MTLLEIAASILAQPTAPFCEDAVRAEIERLLAGLPGVTCRRDGFGNLLAEYRRGDSAPRFAFAAHMDHPGYVGEEFLGGVPESYRAKKPPTRDFGRFSMWDLPAFELREGRIYSRACDDLIGCAAIVGMFHELAAAGAEAACHGLFTRAEEVGFIGAIQLAQSGTLPKNVTVVSLETSSQRSGNVTMGDGVIIRVGDRTSIFDSDATAELVQIATGAKLPFQRALMSGGTCEATAYQVLGYRSCGICVALGNYHNCAPEETIAAEYVSVEDYEGMSRLCVAAAQSAPIQSPSEELKVRFAEWLKEYAEYF
jgi:endoglucanase